MFGHPIAGLIGPAEPGAAAPGVDVAARAAPVAGEVAGFAVPGAGAVTAVQVNVSAQAGTTVTVVCPDGAAGRVAVVVGGARVLIDTSGTAPVGLTPPVVDNPAAPGGARVYALAGRRAR